MTKPGQILDKSWTNRWLEVAIPARIYPEFTQNLPRIYPEFTRQIVDKSLTNR